MTILVVENQIKQYENIAKSLISFGYEVSPKKEEYKAFITDVKVILQGFKLKDDGLNGKYPEARMNKAIKEFKNILTHNVILIDYKLSGSENSGNGLDLAIIIRHYVNTPIIFLSRHSLNNAEIDREFNRYNISNCFWVEKGYAGQALNDRDYFERNVLEIIKSKINFELSISETQEVINTVLTKISNMIKKPGDYIYDLSEVKRNQFLAELEGNSKLFYFNIETPVNNSNNKSEQGRADIQIIKKEDFKQYAFLEAISVSDLNKKSTRKDLPHLTDLQEHVERIYQYDQNGNSINFLLIYFEGRVEFSEFLKKFKDDIEPNFKHNNLQKGDLTEYKHTFGSSIFVNYITIQRNLKQMNFYYIIINCNKNLTK